jgi:CubicO group peptidase (beta-lactamase class C family)
MAKGLSTKGLARLHAVMAGHVERGAMPGLITLVARHGDVHVDVIGAKAFGHPEPMERDAIFRIASLTNAIAAVAAMALVEEGTLQLDAPVDDLLPELAEEELQLRILGPPWPSTPHSPDTWIRRLGTLPLMYQPGEQWLYNTGAQVLGIGAGSRWLTALRPPAGLRPAGSAPHQPSRMCRGPGPRWPA